MKSEIDIEMDLLVKNIKKMEKLHKIKFNLYKKRTKKRAR